MGSFETQQERKHFITKPSSSSTHLTGSFIRKEVVLCDEHKKRECPLVLLNRLV